MDKIIRVSKSGRYQLRKLLCNQRGGQLIIESVAYGAYPATVLRFIDSHYCSEESWERAALDAFRRYENL